MKNLPVCVLLAAGRSERFGSNKLLHRLVDNKTMLQVSLDTITMVLPDTLVVIHPSLARYRSEIERPGIRVIINNQAEQGMSSSIASAIRESEHAAGWMICLADMPYIQTSTLHSILGQFTDSSCIVAPVYESARGHPVIFGSHYKQALLEITGDVGASQLIQKYRDNLVLVDTNDRGVLIDIDYFHELSKSINMT